MNKWLYRFLIALALIGLSLGVLYEMATHTGRGWLYGDAIYQGRPTSYWRARCDEWLERFDTPAEAGQYIPPGISVPMLADDRAFRDRSIRIHPVPQTFWRRLVEPFRSNESLLHEDWPPYVLFGFPGSEPVLEELAQDERYRVLTERPLQYAAIYRKMGHDK